MNVKEFKEMVARIPEAFDDKELWYVELGGISSRDKGLTVHKPVDEGVTITNAESDWYHLEGMDL